MYGFEQSFVGKFSETSLKDLVALFARAGTRIVTPSVTRRARPTNPSAGLATRFLVVTPEKTDYPS